MAKTKKMPPQAIVKRVLKIRCLLLQLCTDEIKGSI